MVKLSGFTCSNAFGPTTAHTGTVLTSPAVWNVSWPQYVPATKPPPGRFAGTIDTVTVAGAVPARGVATSHLAPSEVDTVPVQFNVPMPAFLICSVCAGGV